MTAKGLTAVSIVLNAPSARLRRGAGSPVRIEVRNLSEASISLVGNVDGSQTGVRFPKWIAHVSNLAGDAISAIETSDFTSPLRPADFRRLRPGESFDPTRPSDGAAYFPFAAFDRLMETAGRYSVSLEMDTTEANPAAWQGTLPDRRPASEAEAEEVARRLKEVPQLRVFSDVIFVTVE